MKNRLVVCVDFGSSYTKVAIRIGWDGFTVLADNWSMASRELTFCIPSVVAKVRRGGESEWLVGVDAANQSPGDGVTIYRNWKATLFDELPSDVNGAATQSSATQSSAMQSLATQSLATQSSSMSTSPAPAFDPEVGIAFFSALRKALRERSSLLERDDIPVRICIP
ncbi:MAG: hypothetical protein ABJB74_23460, partial [Gemmatimonas sp.]